MITKLWRLYCLRYVRILIDQAYTDCAYNREYADYVYDKWKRLPVDQLFQIIEDLI